MMGPPIRQPVSDWPRSLYLRFYGAVPAVARVAVRMASPSAIKNEYETWPTKRVRTTPQCGGAGARPAAQSCSISLLWPGTCCWYPTAQCAANGAQSRMIRVVLRLMRGSIRILGAQHRPMATVAPVQLCHSSRGMRRAAVRMWTRGFRLGYGWRCPCIVPGTEMWGHSRSAYQAGRSAYRAGR